MRTSLVFALSVVLFCSCSNDEGSEQQGKGTFRVDTMYARIVVPKDGRCESPCAQTDLVVRYMLETYPGTIDFISFRPLGPHHSWVRFMDYVSSSPANVWFTDSSSTFLRGEDFAGTDTSHVEIILEGRFWRIYEWANTHKIADYGGFRFVDTLLVPVERP